MHMLKKKSYKMLTHHSIDETIHNYAQATFNIEISKKQIEKRKT